LATGDIRRFSNRYLEDLRDTSIFGEATRLLNGIDLISARDSYSHISLAACNGLQWLALLDGGYSGVVYRLDRWRKWIRLQNGYTACSDLRRLLLLGS